MTQNLIVKNAKYFYQQENYERSLELYRKAKEMLESRAFDYNINKCLKKIEHRKSKKTNTPTSSHFEKIYLVNLDFEKEKRIKAVYQLKRLNIDFEIVDAVNGREGRALECYNNIIERGLGNLNHFHEFNEKEILRGKPFIESPGAVGYIYTYINIMRDALSKGYKKILIIEDDVILQDDFENKLTDFLLNIEDNWKIIQLGASQYNWDSVDLENAKRQGWYRPKQLHTCGSFCIGLDSSILEELISLQENFDAPFDHLPLGEIYEKYNHNCYVIFPNIVMPDVSDSNIRGGRDQFSHGKKMKWEVERFRYPPRKPNVAVLIEDGKIACSFNLDHIQVSFFTKSIDGLRPVHQFGNKIKGVRIDEGDAIVLGDYDYIAKSKPGASILESDVIEYLNYQLSITPENRGNLRHLKVADKRMVIGRASVIIPSYKRPENLARAVSSVIDQDYPDLEVIIVSDNHRESEYEKLTDLEVSKIESEIKYKKNIRLIYIKHSVNRNGASARNTGFLVSTGEFISYLDDDDIYLRNRIKEVVSTLHKSPYYIGASNCGFLGWNSPDNDIDRYKNRDLFLNVLSLNYKSHYIHTNTVTYKRSVIMSVNGFDESYKRHQDLEFNLRVLKAYKIKATEKALVRLNPEPSLVDNKVYEEDFLELKIKFLKQFVKELNLADREAVIDSHYEEIKRYYPSIEVLEELDKNLKLIFLNI